LYTLWGGFLVMKMALCYLFKKEKKKKKNNPLQKISLS
jgi:small neutral amino acid transporter SnatA (MarC family)